MKLGVQKWCQFYCASFLGHPAKASLRALSSTSTRRAVLMLDDQITRRVPRNRTCKAGTPHAPMAPTAGCTFSEEQAAVIASRGISMHQWRRSATRMQVRWNGNSATGNRYVGVDTTGGLQARRLQFCSGNVAYLQVGAAMWSIGTAGESFILVRLVRSRLT